MNKKQQCKIVQDLLPNYIEKLTDEETNKFIEEHIRNCSECQEIINDMKNDLQIEIKETKKQLNPLKKIKNRYKIIVAISVLVTIILVLGIIYFKDNYIISKDENGKIKIEKYTIDEKIMANCRHVIIYGKQKQKDTIDGYLYYTYILSINQDEICVNARVKEEGYTIEKINQKYQSYISNRLYDNIEKNDKEIIKNDKNYIKKNKNIIIKKIEESIENIVIVEY